VPEASVDKDGNSCREKDEISPTADTPNRSDVDPIPKSKPMRGLSNSELGGGITTPNRAHPSGGLLG
jgi:hypothetical protein